MEPLISQARLLELAALDKGEFEPALKRILRTLAETAEVDRASFWLLAADRKTLTCEECYCKAADRFERGMLVLESDSPQYFEAIRAEKIIAADDTLADLRTRDLEPYLKRHGIRALLDVPVWVQGVLTGVLCHEHTGGPRHWTLLERDFALGVGQMVATALEARERARAQDSARRWELLAEASTPLLECLEIEAAAREVARLCVCFLAELCVVDVVDNGAIRRIARECATPDLERKMVEMERRYPLTLASPHPAAATIRTGRPFFIADSEEVVLDAYSVDATHAALMRALGPASLLTLPLIAGTRVLGALTLATRKPKRYGPADLELGEQLARRLALGIANASRFHACQTAVKVLDEFMALAAHELYTPITALLLAVQALLRAAAAAPGHDKLELVERQATRLAHLVHTLMDVSRVRSRRLSLKLERVDLVALVRDVATMLTDVLARSGCVLHLTAPSSVEGLWDKSRMEQVVTNLLGNAAKFGARRPIDVTITEEGGLAVLDVTDHGIGVAREDLCRIFDRFERAVPTTEYGGLGLGLYLSREIVRAHGGTIEVESEPGAGARFVVKLPREGPPAPIAAHEDG